MTPQEFAHLLDEYGYQKFAIASDKYYGTVSMPGDRELAALSAKNKIVAAYEELYSKINTKE